VPETSLRYQRYHDDRDVVPGDQTPAGDDARTWGRVYEAWRPVWHCSYCQCCMDSLGVAPSGGASLAVSLQTAAINTNTYKQATYGTN